MPRVPVCPQLQYLPFPFTQRVSAEIPCDGSLLVFELSGSMFRSWAVSFGDCINIKEHVSLLSLFTTLIHICCNIDVPFIVETVVDSVEFWGYHKGELSGNVQPKSFRLWIPLTGAAQLAFVAECRAMFRKRHGNDDDDAAVLGRPAKRSRMGDGAKKDDTSGDDILMHTQQQLVSALRLYFGGTKTIDGIDFDSAEDPNYILRLLSADLYFSDQNTIRKHTQQRLRDSQRVLNTYYCEHTFRIDPEIVPLCRLFTPGDNCVYKSGRDIFKFLLPQFVPSRNLVLDKIRSVLDSVGLPFDDAYLTQSVESLFALLPNANGVFGDPIAYAPIEISAQDALGAEAFMTSQDQVLQSFYAVSAAVNRTNQTRVLGAAGVDLLEVRRVYSMLHHEMTTLLGTTLDGVPRMYGKLFRETNQMLESLRATTGLSPQQQLTRRMFFQTSVMNGLIRRTGLGTRILKCIVGSASCLRLMKQQQSLFLFLYYRHFSVAANRLGIGSGFVIVCGPPETGKSRAGEHFLNCVSPSLRMENDGSSAKSYTAVDREEDMRCVFQDEIKELLCMGNDNSDAHSSSNVKALQSLLSKGYTFYERLELNATNNEYGKRKYLNVKRRMLVGCTNAVSSIPPAIKSRACVVPIIKEFTTKFMRASVNSLVTTKNHKSVREYETSFMQTLQLLSGLQGRFWQNDAFGGMPLDINDNMMTLLQALFEADHGYDVLPARRVLDILDTAHGLMVMDLISLWYSRGLGAEFDYNPVDEAMFYATRAVLRMEHVVCAMFALTSTISMQTHRFAVVQILKTLIRTDESDYPLMTTDKEYYVLKCSRKTLISAVETQLPQMGDSLVQQLLEQIQRGSTMGLANLKLEQNEQGQEQMLINCHFLAPIASPVEKAILDTLKNMTDDPTKCTWSYDEEYYVYKSGVRKLVMESSLCARPDLIHPALQNIPSSQRRFAIEMLRRRETKTGERMWDTPSAYETCRMVHRDTPQAEKCRRLSGFKVRASEVGPLIVHRSLFDMCAPSATNDAYTGTYLKALQIAGGMVPGTRVVLGPGLIDGPDLQEHYLTIPEPPHDAVAVTIRNPLYAPSGHLGMHLLFDATEGDPTAREATMAVDDDPMFPREHEELEFSNTSELEERLVQHRYRQLYQAECPEKFLPRYTNYM